MVGPLFAGCSDRPAQLLPVDCPKLGPAPTAGFGAGPNKAAERQYLCPGLAAIQAASCEDLASVDALSAALRRIAVAPVCCTLKWTGLLQDPLELASALIGLATHAHPEAAGLRFVSSNSGNGWVPCIAAAYLQRVHGGSFNGLALSLSKSEWSNSPATRVIMRMLNLTWRHAGIFDARNESALMSYRPQTRSSLFGAFSSPATAFLPSGWEAWPDAAPFDVCLRVHASSGAVPDTDAAISQDWNPQVSTRARLRTRLPWPF